MELGSSADDVKTSVHLHSHHEKNEDKHKEHHFHVLAVDDSLIDRKLLERLLSVSSYQVTCVDSGNKALEFLGLMGVEEKEYESSSKHSQNEASKINMIMTDYSMPGITGYDLLKKIKDSSNWKNVPVIVMSSENVPSRISMCLEGGAEEFLLKPLKVSDLEKLRSHLMKHISHCDEEKDDSDAIAITVNEETNANVVVCNKGDKGSDASTNCSSNVANTNKRKTISSTNKSTSGISSDVSDRRARVQELSVS